MTPVPGEHTCRSCGSADLKMVLSLGTKPLANALLTRTGLARPEARFPLELMYCSECALVQILETVPPEDVFRDYVYFSSFSDTMLKHAHELVAALTESRGLDNTSFVVEIASNDGYLLQYYKALGVPVLGVDPAVNVAAVAEAERGIPTITEFFGEALAQQLLQQGKRADVIHAHNVLAHVADLNGVVGGLSILLKDDGVAVIEVPYVRDLIDNCEFDTIYHEHLCYFSATALKPLFERHGLMVQHIERVPIHGGSLRLFVSRDRAREIGNSVARILQEEVDWGVTDWGTYALFGERVEHLRDSLTELLAGLKRAGKRIAAYGAAAKGSTLLNYMEVGTETIDFVADRSPYKHGRYMSGVHIPVYAPSMIREAMPDYVLILAWNLVDEIMTELKDYQLGGGRFIIPLPRPRIV